MPTSPYAAPRASTAEAGALRADLTEAEYTVEHVNHLLGPVPAAALHRGRTEPAERALAGSRSAAAVLVRLLVLGEQVGAGPLAGALPRTGVDGLRAMGLLAPADGAGDEARVRATCDLRPYGDDEHGWWLASDVGELRIRGPLPTDHVLGIGGASTTLARWTARPLVGRALDLGTGCGIQALHLAGHAGTVTATDISDRALDYARFNAALNGLDLDLRKGSLLEPVEGEEFDLIVSNPPFVITPRTAAVPTYEYRDGGATGDAVVGGLVRGLGRHLAPGGLAQLLGNWETAEGEDWRDRVSGWLEGTGLDAWVLQRESQDPAEYAETWVRDGGHRPGTPEFARLYAAWLDDFVARGVTQVGFGVIILQRPVRPRPPWRDLVEAAAPVADPMGPAVLDGVRARTWLAEHDRDALLDTAWRVAPDVTEERVGRPGSADPCVIQLRQGGGLRRTVRLDTVGAALAGVCDGELTARQALGAIAALVDADRDDVLAAGVELLSELVAAGMLTGLPRPSRKDGGDPRPGDVMSPG